MKSGGYHTSDRVLWPLSEIVRRVCNEREGRRTVLDRDLPES